MKLRLLLLACGGCLALLVATLFTRRIVPAVSHLPVRTDGTFPLNGQFVGQPFAGSAGVRLWGSWAGGDAHTGALALGPFTGPPTLRFATSGYASHPGNGIYLELGTAEARQPVPVPHDGGERWVIVETPLPPAWVGRPVTLHARDASTDLGGWLAISEPLRGGRGTGAEFLESLTAWSVNGLLLALLWFAAMRVLAPRRWVAPYWLPLVAAAWIALLGYVAFWSWFAHPLLGKIVSFGLLAFAAITGFRAPPDRAPPDPETTAITQLLFAVGVFYVCLLHLFPSSLDFDSLAANRFREALPGDNTLPRNVAVALLHAHELRQPGPEWQSSDRPPLQSGWLLLTLPVTSVLALDERTANGTAAIWFQSLWIFAAYGLFRSLGLAPARIRLWLAVLTLSGFFLQHTTFVWPKLSAAAFACGAVGLWLFPRDPAKNAPLLLGGLLAGLAWLSHGGVAFSFLALVPWVLWRVPRDGWRRWLLAAAISALLAAPWFAYQKFYDPPGDRLLKMHLAGVLEKDPRGVWPVIRGAYHTRPWSEIIAHKLVNLRVQVSGTWAGLVDFSTAGAPHRRDDEFFYPARALTWWLLGLAALPIAIARGRLRSTWRAHANLLGWTLLTVLLWCVLMFTGGQAVIHQGSFAVMLTLFVLLSVWSELAGPWTIAVVAVPQAVTFATTWAVPNATIHGPLNFFASALAIASLVLLASLCRPDRRQPASPPSTTPQTLGLPRALSQTPL